MKLITRQDLGWPPSAAADWPTALGIKIHYEGTPVHIVDHSQCMPHWTDIRNSHLANTAEGYVDVAYNFAVCLHGYVLEGRGLRKKTGANGNQTLNGDHYAVVAFLGDDGDTQPTQAMISGIQDAIRYFRENGAGKEIKGHRDGYATSCPGDPLYALVTSGALEPPIPSPAPESSNMTAVVYEGEIPLDRGKVINLVPVNTPLGVTQRWLSFVSDFGDAVLRIAVFRDGVWEVKPTLKVPANVSRVNLDLGDNYQKVSVRRDTGDAAGLVTWMVEAK